MYAMKHRDSCPTDPQINGRSPTSGIAALLAAVWALSACAPLPPVPFQLLDKGKTYVGSFLPEDRRVEVTIGDRHYSGFYILAAGTAYSQGGWSRRGLPNDTLTRFNTNSARATMKSEDGDHLFCEFVFDNDRAIGECKSGDGRSYQLVTQPR